MVFRMVPVTIAACIQQKRVACLLEENPLQQSKAQNASGLGAQGSHFRGIEASPRSLPLKGSAWLDLRLWDAERLRIRTHIRCSESMDARSSACAIPNLSCHGNWPTGFPSERVS